MDNMYQFDIFGKTLRLQTTDGNEDDLIRVVKYFMDNVKQVYDANPNRAQTEVLTLAGIKITDELFSLAKRVNNGMPDAQRKNSEIISEIENLLDNLQ